MTDNRQAVSNHSAVVAEGRSTGDAAVDGLLAGLAAGVVMALYLVLNDLTSGSAPAEILARFNPGAGGSPLAGALIHTSVAGVYGVLYGIFYPHIVRKLIENRAPDWLAGVAYEIVFFVFATNVLLPSSSSPLRGISALHFGIAHLLYGLVLGVLVARALNNG